MPSVDECKRYAEQCLRWADAAKTEQERDTLLEIARLWTALELLSPPPSEADGTAPPPQSPPGSF